MESAVALAARTPLQQQTFVVVDLETTGGSATYDRILEVAALRVRDGVVEDRLDTLIDPCVPIPPFITRLTGISQGMVRGRPIVDDVLPRLAEFTRDAVVVAHNASFDYGFLQSAFIRANQAWQAERLCTLRLARRLLPGLHSYKLDSLCAHLGLSYVQRHRARPDAEATVSLLQHLLETAQQQGVESLSQLLQLQGEPVSKKRRKGQVDEAQVVSLPSGPGVYLLKDNRGHIVYIGKSVNVRQRVRQHLRPSGTASSPGQPSLRKRLPYVVDVEAIETGSELEALTLESRLVKRYLPDANRLLRDSRDYPWVKLDEGDGYPRLLATRERPGEDGLYFGPFRKSGSVASAVLFLSEQLGLRQCHEPIRPSMPTCPLVDLKKCLGPCTGAISQAEYRAAADRAERVLRGEDTGVLDNAVARRDQLAEELRFEEAAEIRDRIRDLEHLVGAQQRLTTFAERNLAVVARDTGGRSARLFLVRAGRLARELSVPLPAQAATIKRLLREVYVEQSPTPVSRDEVDEMVILDTWLRHHREEAREVAIPLYMPEAAAPDLLAALKHFAPAKPTPVPTTRRARH